MNRVIAQVPASTGLKLTTKRCLSTKNGLYHHQLTTMDRNEKMRYMLQSYVPNHRRVMAKPTTKTYRLKGTPKIEDALYMIKSDVSKQHAA